MQAKEKLTTLCGLSKEETELDFSRQSLGAGDAVLIANDISNMGAVSSLNLSKCSLTRSKLKEMPRGWTIGDGVYGREDHHYGTDISGVTTLANAIKDMRALTSINVKENNITAAEEERIYQLVRMNKLGVALSDKTLTELDVSGIGFGAEGAKLVAQYISDNGALTSLNLSANELGQPVVPEGWSHGYHGDYSGSKFWKHTDGRRQNEKPGKPEGIIAIANAIKDMRALSVLSLKKNNLCNQEAGKALSEMLAVNTVLKELDVSENTYYKCDSAGFAQELAVGISDNGALSTFTFSGEEYGSSRPVTMETTMTEADFSGKELGVSGGMLVAARAFLPKCQ
jgi:Leucine-rich repeat (LRR) protein